MDEPKVPVTVLIRILGNLVRRRDRFDHILIETTGLADPAPIAQTFFVDQEVANQLSPRRHRLPGRRQAHRPAPRRGQAGRRRERGRRADRLRRSHRPQQVRPRRHRDDRRGHPAHPLDQRRGGRCAVGAEALRSAARTHEARLFELSDIALVLEDCPTARGVGQWFRAHSRPLNRRRPLDVFAEGDVEAVRSDAEAFAEGVYL